MKRPKLECKDENAQLEDPSVERAQHSPVPSASTHPPPANAAPTTVPTQPVHHTGKVVDFSIEAILRLIRPSPTSAAAAAPTTRPIRPLAESQVPNQPTPSPMGAAPPFWTPPYTPITSTATPMALPLPLPLHPITPLFRPFKPQLLSFPFNTPPLLNSSPGTSASSSGDASSSSSSNANNDSPLINFVQRKSAFTAHPSMLTSPVGAGSADISASASSSGSGSGSGSTGMRPSSSASTSSTARLQCQMCGKVFGRNWLLKGHVRTHTGERPYACEHCDKRFADKSNLRAHMQTHSIDKRYSCHRCGRRFALKSYLSKHESSSCNIQGGDGEEAAETDGAMNTTPATSRQKGEEMK